MSGVELGGVGWMQGFYSKRESLALGWTLLHFCWQGAAIAGLYALADRITARAAAGLRYAVALGALALMPLAVLTTFAVEMRSLDAGADSISQSARRLADAGHLPRIEFIRQDAPKDASGKAHGAGWLAAGAEQAEQILPWMDLAWIAGVLLLAVRALGGWRQLEDLRRTASDVVPASIEESFKRICTRLEIGRRVALRISDHVISPMAMGVFRATVILPVSAVMRLSVEEMEAVLAHELGHIRRWDYAWNLMQTALETVLFFHPAVWWVSRKVRYRREVCCDEIAVQSCADALVYARTLLRLEEQKFAEVRLAAALAGSRGSLLGRIERVLGEDEGMENKMTSRVRVGVAATILMGLLLGPKVNDAVAASRPVSKDGIALTAQTATSGTADKIPAVRAENAQAPRAVIPAPVVADVHPAPVAAVIASAEPSPVVSMQSEEKAAAGGVSYIEGMRAAGYALDLNKDFEELVSMKSLGVTPEYAKQMAGLGFGKPSLEQLISMKALGVTPEYIAEMNKSGLGPKGFEEAVQEKALGITPEYASEMKKTGFEGLNLEELVSLKALGVTPEYVTWLKQRFPQITMDQMRQAAVFHLDEKFLAQSKSHGFDSNDVEKLLRLKMSGLMDQ